MRHAHNDNDSWTSLGFQTLLILNRLKNSTQTNGLGDALPIDQKGKNDEIGSNGDAEHAVERKANDAKRMSA